MTPGETRNRILLALSASERGLVEECCRPVELQRGDVLARPGERVTSAHFPEDAVISSVAEYADGSIIEMASIGREGCNGLGLLLRDELALSTSLVQIAGPAHVMGADDMARLCLRLPSFETVLFRYARAFMHQVRVSAACNGAHQLERRLSRWLLTMADRSDGREMPLTQEFLAEMLGVQRPSLTSAAQKLLQSGLIEYRRGRITIRDRAGLERASCECYALVRSAYDRLLPAGGD